MKLLRAIGARLASLFERNRRNQEMDLEILSHIEMQTRDNIAAGMSGEDARTAAFRQFGRMEAIKETCRDQRRIAWLENFLQDTHFAVRMLGKKPGFTAVAVATLALCLGANLAIFAVTNSILLRSLPFPQAGRLVALYNSYPRAGVDRDGSSVACYYERRQAIPAFQSLSIYRPDSAIVGETGATEREEVLRVSPEFFATLGIQLPHGRTFIDEETTYGSDHVAIITDAYWKQHFQGASNVLGRTLRMDGYPKTIIAILPPGYRFLSHRAQLYLPLSSNASQRTAIERHSGSGTEMIGRLRPAATLAEATAQVAAHNAALADTYPRAKMIAEAGFHTVLLSLHGDHVKSVQPVLFSLQAAALLLLLIGGANLANLYLIRVTDRAREFGIRRSLGASRPRMVSQIVTETLLTTLAGGILGLGVAAMGLRLLGTLGVRQLPLGGEVVFDTPLAIIGLLLAVLAGLLISIPVVWFGLRGDPSRSLRSEARGATANTASQRLRHGFIAVQIALAFILLAGASLLRLSLDRALAVSPGFRVDHVLSGRISLPWKNYQTTEAQDAFIQRLLAEMGHLPGMQAAAAINSIPLSGTTQKSAITVKGYIPPPGESLRGHFSYGVAGDYFAAMGIPLREGRLLGVADAADRVRSCVVDEAFARRYWPAGHALGQRLTLGGELAANEELFTVVGVVGGIKQEDLTESEAQGAVYFPFRHRSDSTFYLVTRTSQPPEALGAALQNTVRRLDPELPVNDLQSMEVRLASSLLTRRSPALLTSIFAGTALLLAVLGTYGVLSYAVMQRRREIGVRLALGALPRQIAAQFLTLGGKLLAAGAVMGIVGAWISARTMQGILFGIPRLPLSIMVGAGAILALAALAACLLPIWRALRVAPAEALKND